ncbi:MAG: YhbY family RNA-binding protein [Gammaproteobacteria bacterium]|nr:YhbY family RNA-binding protein [Gammaproteobacteria bacterium]
MKITAKQRLYLRKMAHPRKVTVILGQHGLTQNVLHEIDLALAHHELIKVRINVSEREQRRELIAQIATDSGGEVIQQIGHLGVFYRRAEKPTIVLPP